jgi:hypothetical protein
VSRWRDKQGPPDSAFPADVKTLQLAGLPIGLRCRHFAQVAEVAAADRWLCRYLALASHQTWKSHLMGQRWEKFTSRPGTPWYWWAW